MRRYDLCVMRNRLNELETEIGKKFETTFNYWPKSILGHY